MIKKTIIFIVTFILSSFLVGYTFVPGTPPIDVEFDDAAEHWIVEGDYRILDEPIFPNENYKRYTITLPTGSVIEYRDIDNVWHRIPNESAGVPKYNEFKFTAEYSTLGYWSIHNNRSNFLPIYYSNESELDTFKIRYFYIDLETLPEEQYHTVEQLPQTNGSVFTEIMDMGYVSLYINGLNMVTHISYNGDNYYVKNSFAPGTDMDLFEDKEAYYYTHKDEKFIVFYHGDYSVLTDHNFRRQTFIPYTVWNLSTNEIETFDRFNVYLYSRKEDANNVYAYFYVDEFVIDNLLSVSLAFRYRYNYLIGSPGAWQEVYKVLEADKEVFGDTTSWQYDLLKNSGAAMNIEAALRISSLLTLNFPLLFSGTPILEQTNLVQQGKTMEIKPTTPSTALRNEIEQAYSSAYDDFEGINPNLQLFKLHLGQYNKEWSTGIEIDADYSLENEQKGINIIQFTYSTQGQVYTIEGKNINPIFVQGPGTTPQPDNPLGGILDQILNGIIMIGVIIVGIIVFYFLFKHGVLFDVRKFLTFLFIVGILLLIFVLYRQGIFDELFLYSLF